MSSSTLIIETGPDDSQQVQKLPSLIDAEQSNNANNSESFKKELTCIDSNLFTFKPKLNPKSLEIAQNILNFYERQDLHSKKQLNNFEEAFKASTNDYGKLFLMNNYSSKERNFLRNYVKVSLNVLFGLYFSSFYSVQTFPPVNSFNLTEVGRAGGAENHS
jgi:hypothetical protein